MRSKKNVIRFQEGLLTLGEFRHSTPISLALSHYSKFLRELHNCKHFYYECLQSTKRLLYRLQRHQNYNRNNYGKKTKNKDTLILRTMILKKKILIYIHTTFPLSPETVIFNSHQQCQLPNIIHFSLIYN